MTSIPEKFHNFSCIIIIINELPLNLSLKFITPVILGFCDIQVVRQLDTKFGYIICKQDIVYTSCTKQ
jgi:hypothetical protein